MNSNAQVDHYSLPGVPSGWIVVSLAVVAWLPLFAAWNAFAAISALLM